MMKRKIIIFAFMIAAVVSVTTGCYVGYAQRHDRGRHEGREHEEHEEHRDH